ncbi:hypothetical protein AX14_012786 [Amanita brunnescens Koide BX004]|nr:hypothetical protein AX14_012786 [Amanita brunnescens Koide BX004]
MEIEEEDRYSTRGTSDSEIGPARDVPSGEVIAEAQGEEPEYDSYAYQDPEDEMGLFAGTEAESEEEACEAEKNYRTHLNSVAEIGHIKGCSLTRSASVPRGGSQPSFTQQQWSKTWRKASKSGFKPPTSNMTSKRRNVPSGRSHPQFRTIMESPGQPRGEPKRCPQKHKNRIKAHKSVPTLHEIWSETAQLLEQETVDEAAKGKEPKSADIGNMIEMGVRALRKHGVPRTSEVIVKARIAMEIEDLGGRGRIDEGKRKDRGGPRDFGLYTQGVSEL